jgi:glycerophosphoryl diester phosphodiesterase
VRLPRVVAHRGSSARHADNSWAACAAALAEGADAIEFVVVATRDGVLVVRHELALDGRPVAELDFAAVRSAEVDLPRFDDLLAWAKRSRIDLLVEVKDPAAVHAVASEVRASGWHERIVVGGFHGPALAALKRAHPGIRTSFMMGSVVTADDLVHLAAAYCVDGVHPCWEGRAPRPHRLLDAPFVDRLRRAGLAITLWHEEDEDELRALVALQPDAICTNTPAVLRAIVDAPERAHDPRGGTPCTGKSRLPPSSAAHSSPPRCPRVARMS